jgi:hypothetical protein
MVALYKEGGFAGECAGEANVPHGVDAERNPDAEMRGGASWWS